MKFCDRCGCKVDESGTHGYRYSCPIHDEDLFLVEVFESHDVRDILYGCHLHRWAQDPSDDRVDPLPYEIFMDYEFRDHMQMEYLLTMYGMHHKLADYKRTKEGSE